MTIRPPADDRLGHRLAMLFGDAREGRIIQQPAAAQRAPAFDVDVMDGMKVPDAALLEPGMQLDLVDDGRHAGFADDPLQMVLVEIRNADRLDAAGLPELDQRLPGLGIFVLAGHRPVDQEQVDLLDAELVHRHVEGAQRRIALVRTVAQLGRDEQFASRHAGAADRLSDPLLILVALGGIDQAIAGLDPQPTASAVMSLVDLPHAKAELGNGGAVVQRNLFRHGGVFCKAGPGGPPGAQPI